MLLLLLPRTMADVVVGVDELWLLLLERRRVEFESTFEDDNVSSNGALHNDENDDDVNDDRPTDVAADVVEFELVVKLAAIILKKALLHGFHGLLRSKAHTIKTLY